MKTKTATLLHLGAAEFALGLLVVMCWGTALAPVYIVFMVGLALGAALPFTVKDV